MPQAPYPPPVFILAPARSCSTVTLALLAGHPDIFGFPEMLLFTQETVGEVLDSTVFTPGAPDDLVRMRIGGICRAVSEIRENSQSADALDRAYRWLRERSDWSSVRLFGHLLERVSPQVGLEKSPNTSNSTERLMRCIDGFPQARFIHLVRHPVATQRSMREHWAASHAGLSTEESSLQCATSWYLSHHRIRKALSGLPADRALTVRAEELLGDPRNALGPLFAWLGLSSDDAVVQGALRTERWRFAGTGEAGGLYGGDSKFMHAPELRPLPDPGPLTFPGEWQLPERICEQMSDMARSFGYS